MPKLYTISDNVYSGNRIPQLWHEQIFVAHLFRHPDYGLNS